MQGFLPQRVELEGTVERSLSTRLAPAAGRVVGLFFSSGAVVARGAAVLSIAGEAYSSAQHDFIKALRRDARATPADLAHTRGAEEAALTGLKFARSQIDHIRATGLVIDPLPVLCPADALLFSTMPSKTSFLAGASLFSYGKEHYVRCWMDAKHAEYLRPGKLATVSLLDGRHLGASFDRLGAHDQGGVREVRLRTETLLTTGQAVQVEFNFDWYERVTSTCTPSDWPYPNPPRGGDLRRLLELHARKTGAPPPPIGRPAPPTVKPSTSPIVSPLGSRPQRPVARYNDPALPVAPVSTRHSLFIDPNEFARLRISTSKAILTPFIPHWRCMAQVMEDAPSEQPFHVLAPFAGTFIPAPLRRSDTVAAGQLVGTLRLTEPAITAQRAILGDGGGSVREHAARTLRTMGFVNQDYDTIRLRQAPITEVQINATTSGVILEYAEQERDVLAGQGVMQLLCINVHLVRAVLGADEFTQLPTVVKAELCRPSRTEALYSIDTMPVTERSRTERGVLFEAIFPADKEKLKPGHIMDLVLSDPTSSAVRLCVPRDCIMKIAESTEVLIHSRGGAFTPTAIKIGTTRGELVEVLGGLAEGSLVVRDLKPLSFESPQIRAIMGGFWDPSARSTRRVS